MQKILTVYTSMSIGGEKKEEGIDEVRELLDNGWHIVSVSPMGGAAMTLEEKDSNRFSENLSLLLLGSIVVLSDNNPICSI